MKHSELNESANSNLEANLPSVLYLVDIIIILQKSGIRLQKWVQFYVLPKTTFVLSRVMIY